MRSDTPARSLMRKPQMTKHRHKAAPVDLNVVVERQLAEALAKCRCDWQRHAIGLWSHAHPDPRIFEMGYLGPVAELPIPCRCLDCKVETAVIFPSETNKMADAYCICPCCSFHGCPHKDQPEQVAA